MDSIYIQKVTAGDINAFEYFVEKYKGKAFSVAFSVVRDSTLADDVVQDAFINAYKKIETFRGDSTFSTWLMRIVVNQGIKVLRKKKVQFERSKEFAYEVIDSNVNESIKSMQAKEQQFYIDKTLKTMTAREASILQLFYLQELSLKEIEEIMELSADHVKVILHRARKQFYGILQKELKHELTSII
ncbi:MAG: sigma-70 family RNA polymerase sigma factor [Salinivirgaceae bacterium]|nr:sigma-70 family RNA polymerase sigma factor [Salinivirgaceae bacterium]